MWMEYHSLQGREINRNKLHFLKGRVQIERDPPNREKIHILHLSEGYRLI
jgi:hypothetical protein